MIFSCIYRPPNTDASFFDYLNKSVDSIVLENKETHIVGDFNINLLNDASLDSRKLIRVFVKCKRTPHVLWKIQALLLTSDHNPTILIRKQNANLK